MLPDLDDVLVMHVEADHGVLLGGKITVRKWVNEQLEDSCQIVDALGFGDDQSQVAFTLITSLRADVLDGLTEEYYAEAKEAAKNASDADDGSLEEWVKDEIIELELKFEMPSAESLEEWVNDHLNYNDLYGIFAERVIDEVYAYVHKDYPQVGQATVNAALKKYYCENPRAAWRYNKSTADDAIMAVENQLEGIV